MSENLKNIKQSLLHERLSAFLKSTTGIVHNLSNPLTIIAARAQLLQMKMPDNPNFKKMVDQSKTIESILNNLVFISQNLVDEERHKIDINILMKNEMEFLNADSFFKHNVSKDFQYYPGSLITSSSYFHVATLVYCIMQVLLTHLKKSSEKVIKFRTVKASDSAHIRISSGAKVMEPSEIQKMLLSSTSKSIISQDPLLQNLYNAKLLAKEMKITLTISCIEAGIEFTISIPIM